MRIGAERRCASRPPQWTEGLARKGRARHDFAVLVRPGGPTDSAQVVALARAGLLLRNRATAVSVGLAPCRPRSRGAALARACWHMQRPRRERTKSVSAVAAGPRRSSFIACCCARSAPDYRAADSPPCVDAQTPVAAIQHAHTPQRRSVLARLGTLADAIAAEGLGRPAILVIGAVVAAADSTRLDHLDSLLAVRSTRHTVS
jgi:siroheme synthase